MLPILALMKRRPKKNAPFLYHQHDAAPLHSASDKALVGVIFNLIIAA